MKAVVVDPELPEQARRELETLPVALLVGFGDPPPAPRKRVVPWRRQDVAVACHRRYVVPQLDLHGEAASLWERASRAARTIRTSAAVTRGLIDSVQVSAVLPYHLWEVAERLALLSASDGRQSGLLGKLDASDPDVRAVLDSQRATRELTVADVESRIGDLEGFAELAERADGALNRERAIRELAGLTPEYDELRARLGGSANALTATGGVADELRAVASEADAAVRRANEAGRTLSRR